MAAAMIKQAPRTSGQPVLRRWNSTSPATVSTNAKRVSETRGIKDTPLTRTFGTWLNGEMFNTDWLTCNVSPISSTNTNAPSAPPSSRTTAEERDRTAPSRSLPPPRRRAGTRAWRPAQVTRNPRSLQG
ncbi:MAG: hypothetical protein ACXVIB_05175 [Halobacteriota archaeon]